ncbi:DUF1707 SHOCT-like domain-containing protein [Streptomyces cavernicola]|uniref:DUF1707 domain-containing protein n=1 Tax=Streptomyces cavernicola TaxID=3043613 RepID=A0ABT6SJB7_9ACTN|nr:DUF1707 domain-containing protein [Streptomyces sp. B-S-A6]MDI3407964.1 DUF1707 domain-containing protein [Streptomyces sp. B-S-A6]
MTDESPELRASDADRERVAERLREAVAEGRLDMEEFQERLDATYKARTYGELAPVTRDLPDASAPSAVPARASSTGTGAWAERIGGAGTSSRGVAIMSGFSRKGVWTVPRRFNCFAFWGGGEVDLREARFEAPEVVVNCVAIMGGVDVIVPPGVEVVVRGIGVMGGFEERLGDDLPERGAPRVIVTGFAFWGGVGVKRKVTRAQKRQLKEERRRGELE